MVYVIQNSVELYHHGVKGQKWGVRRYQYADGSLTPEGRRRRQIDSDSSTSSRMSRVLSTKVKDLTNNALTIATGKQYVDGFLKEGTTLNRIQTSKEFENFAFYATYKKADSEKYMGLFGKNLASRAERDAVSAEKVSNATGSEEDISKAKELRERSNNLKVYQLHLKTTNKLKIPSDENAADITNKLLKEEEFKNNLVESIRDSKEKMRRPQQQMLFRQAENALRKDPNRMTDADKVAVYKAFNLSLTNHNAQEIAAQDRFYSEMKKKGYNALLDYNDKEYSSYHAKRPMIVFDTDKVRLESVMETDPAVVEKHYKKYNTERIAKEALANTFGLISRAATMTVSECDSYVRDKTESYLNDGR